MKKFLVVYVSRTGKTKQMAEWIAEGLRIAGHEAVLRTLPQVKQVKDISGYDGYVLGSPTYHKAMIEGFNSWLFKAQRAGVRFFFTWNVSQFVLWETTPAKTAWTEQNYKTWLVTHIHKEEHLELPMTAHAVKGWLKTFLEQ